MVKIGENIGEILAIKEVEVRSFKHRVTVISNTKDGTEEIKTRILAPNKAHSSLKTIFRSKYIHRNNKIDSIKH
jgi:hypothetical protein